MLSSLLADGLQWGWGLGEGGLQEFGMLRADQQASSLGVLVTDQRGEGKSVRAGVAGRRRGERGVIPAPTPPPLQETTEGEWL